MKQRDQTDLLIVDLSSDSSSKQEDFLKDWPTLPLLPLFFYFPIPDITGRTIILVDRGIEQYNIVPTLKQRWACWETITRELACHYLSRT